MKLTFVRATEDDIEDLIEVRNKAFYSDYIKYGYCPGYGRTANSMLLSLQECSIYNIITDDIIVGSISVRYDGENSMFLGCLCVIPEYESRGIGTLAISFIESTFTNANHWSLETPADKERNILFYKKCGYGITKEYRDGTVEIVLLEKNIEVK